MEAVCREAVAAFDGERAQLWTLTDDEAVLVHQEPHDDDHPPGTRRPRRDIPALEESVARKTPTFADRPSEARGARRRSRRRRSALGRRCRSPSWSRGRSGGS